jgi:hypothetical protein
MHLGMIEFHSFTIHPEQIVMHYSEFKIPYHSFYELCAQFLNTSSQEKYRCGYLIF